MDVRERLSGLDLPRRLEQLGVHDEDRAPITAMVSAVRGDEAELDVVQRMADTVLLPQIGNYLHWSDHPGFEDEYREHRLGKGVLPLVALLATADEVHAAHTARGIPEELSWRSLSDFGHQVAKGRWVDGATGLHNQGWLRNIWADGFLWLERLEFELSEVDMPTDADPSVTEKTVVINTHIPDAGPLDPQVVARDFANAADLFERYYPEAGRPDWYWCHSWLLDPQIFSLVPGSNMERFGQQWELLGGEISDRDGYYFGFNIEPPKGQELPYDLDALPTGSRLHRGVVELWRSVGHVRDGWGRIPTPAKSSG